MQVVAFALSQLTQAVGGGHGGRAVGSITAQAYGSSTGVCVCVCVCVCLCGGGGGTTTTTCMPCMRHAMDCRFTADKRANAFPVFFCVCVGLSFLLWPLFFPFCSFAPTRAGAVCDADGVSTTITFTHSSGALPAVVVHPSFATTLVSTGGRCVCVRAPTR
jgi:hypothetical protein